MLVLSRRCRESLMINDLIEIKVIDISGDKVKIGIEAPRDYIIMRKELCQTVEVNREATVLRATPELLDFLAGLPDEDGAKQGIKPEK